MTMAVHRYQRWLLAAFLTLVAILLPRLTTSGYALNALIDTVRWIIFALSFDLVAGHAGAVSLGHPVFFGTGAYVAAILGPRLEFGFLPGVMLAAVMMAALALVAGIAFFRIRGVTFAIGTLGAAIIAQLIANNAYSITRGPMCIQGVARPEFILPFSGEVLRVTQPMQYYYLLLPLLFITAAIYLSLTRSRLGRAFTAVREDEVRAQAVGVHPLRYKLLAFAVGAGLVGALGAFQAHYVTVVCPSEMAQDLTTTLLIIVFIGGVGSFRGVIIGAVIFSILPRLLESSGTFAMSPAVQQIVYGVILVVVMIFMPGGLDDLLTRLSHRRRLGRRGAVEE